MVNIVEPLYTWKSLQRKVGQYIRTIAYLETLVENICGTSAQLQVVWTSSLYWTFYSA